MTIVTDGKYRTPQDHIVALKYENKQLRARIKYLEKKNNKLLSDVNFYAMRGE